jgi:hypothetical protein
MFDSLLLLSREGTSVYSGPAAAAEEWFAQHLGFRFAR